MEIEPEPFKVEEDQDVYLFTINSKKYRLKKDECLDQVPNFFQLYFDLFDNNASYKMARLFADKKQSLPKLCGNITLEFLSKLEFYLISLERFIEEYLRQKGKKKVTFGDIEKDQCSICLGELYENIESTNIPSIMDNLFNNNKDVIRLPNCEGHYFHYDCMEPYCKNKQHIKCPNCSFIYGTMIGIKHYLYSFCCPNLFI